MPPKRRRAVTPDAPKEQPEKGSATASPNPKGRAKAPVGPAVGGKGDPGQGKKRQKIKVEADGAAAAVQESKTDNDGGTAAAKAPKGKDGKDAPAFLPEEIVYARDNQQLFKAKVLRRRDDPGVGTQYFVHFQGWAVKWDVWLGPHDLFKNTPAMERKAKELDALLRGKRGKSRKGAKAEPADGATTSEPEDDGVVAAAREAKEAETALRAKRAKLKGQQLFDDSALPQLRMSIPMSLKTLAVDDWEKVTKQSLLVPLPRKPCVTEVLKLYLEHKETQEVASDEQVGAKVFVDQLEGYFDEAVAALLLYREEQGQWKEVHTRGLLPSKVFGAEHVLRLLLKLPFLVRKALLQPREVTNIKREATSLLQFLQKESGALFLQEYVDLDTSVRALGSADEIGVAKLEDAQAIKVPEGHPSEVELEAAATRPAETPVPVAPIGGKE